MTITLRNYKLLSDFERVNEFLRHNFTKYLQNGNIQQPFWEYAHTHPAFNHKLTHRFGIWEDNGEIIAVACYEMDLGECLFIAKKGYEEMKPSLLEYAEKELCKVDENQKSLDVWVFDYETELREKLLEKGYKKEYTQLITVFKYENEFVERELPEGYTIISLEDENDFRKINDVLWKGFDHGDEPDDDLDCRRLMQSGPNFRKDLTTIIKAPNGEYACFAGMWMDGVNDYAYLEPLATDPKYRRIGLATIALTEAMKKTKKLGATYCFGGNREFYLSIGFETVCHREMWRKKW
ncbi:GNAT family N-acetyltransferase [Oceanirhabdus sp. W0125-5]|uniref:GNAT family N-acetyltransferase n=1 Tax=Oceanirhabdus sp. W0125-5 TaxID=2999116 RepID=UPI0022F3117A|nr:GNAT family N-acetyltransferase [Oceanirhabdus sp. W0125-5]WBW96398.1 GNAT family N-acetyltransferase [Oceanirhabdus sp. W0125-5]